MPKLAKIAKTPKTPQVPEQGRTFGSFGTFWQNGSDTEWTGAKPAETLESRPAEKTFGSFGILARGYLEKTDPETPPKLPQNPAPGTELHVSVDALVADLKTVLMGDGPESEAAAERLAESSNRTSGPAGDDLPAWQAWMNRRFTVWRTRGYLRVEALGIVWGEAEGEWHKRHSHGP